MFEYIKGTLVSATPQKAVLDNQGLGYLLAIPVSVFHQLPQIGTSLLLFVSTIIREDSAKSYGFLTESERNFFEKLISISGIGPKTALSLIGHLPEGELLSAIHTGNVSQLTKVPGIGKKTAERLVVEMRGSLPSAATPVAQDAISALINLGYSTTDAQKAITKALSTKEAAHNLSLLITLALKQM
ncbi:MAG: Holliday junction branch migration protein RuvA [Simkaniaceae bacterium]|nr:Holliday junction branch migration protein RuvA [Simkaniaceae bacterium]